MPGEKGRATAATDVAARALAYFARVSAVSCVLR